jgi:hypothetical protein
MKVPEILYLKKISQSGLDDLLGIGGTSLGFVFNYIFNKNQLEECW